MGKAIKLIDAPVGLFEVDGVLALKTEYATQHEDGAITPDCYIVESGEYFWGGVDNVEERNNLEVTPVEASFLIQPNGWVSVEERLPEKKQDVLMLFDSGNMAVGWWHDADEDITFWCAYTDDGFYTDCGCIPTHWMPLPEPPDSRPPKGEKNER